MGYEYLIAGFEDIALNEPVQTSEQKLLELLDEQLSASDKELLALLRRKNDDEAVLALLEDDAVLDRKAELSLSDEDFRTQLLYEQGLKCKNKFVRDWFAYNMDVNNVLAAAVAIKHGMDVQKVIVGDNDVAQELRKGGSLGKNARLAALVPDLKEVAELAEIGDLLEREKHIDALRWQWLEERTLFEVFNIEAVLAYYLKAAILHRWDNLTVEQGEQVFRAMVADMKKGVNL
ncbi:MAG: DUF2764 family protein [Paludibacteraceae bacterium]|jgi:Protein of unknown function (DUF2764).|nr:DUF2764 family protein [Paludibacteraceae bacterium]MBO7455081.1 DUF2764 family protein [Paludibacteraceae bacterium]